MKIDQYFVAAAVALSLGLATGASAQTTYPTKPVTIVAAYPPGGTVDLLSRMLSEKLRQEWGQPVIVENRPGASGIIGSNTVARATPDGHTLLVIPITHVTNASLYSSIPFDPLKDFTPISLIAASPMVLAVNNKLAVNSVGDLIALAKEKPGTLNCGSGGNGTSQHLACELFKSMAGVDIQHVPYQGNAAAMTDVISGHIEMLFDQMATAAPHVRNGSAKPLAVSSLERSPAFPDVPTVAESGLSGYETVAWFGLVGPAGMPEDVVAKIRAGLKQAVSFPDVQERLSNLGLAFAVDNPDEFGGFLASELEKWAKVVEASGARLD